MRRNLSYGFSFSVYTIVTLCYTKIKNITYQERSLYAKDPNKDVIAIYSRKSRFTGKGESVGNQVELCRNYIRSAFGDSYADSAVVYEDEGFSGGNLNRPGFKQMMKAARQRQFRRWWSIG